MKIPTPRPETEQANRDGLHRIFALLRMISTFIVILCVLAAGGGIGYWFLRVQTYHLEVVTPGVLYRDGNRGLREFANMLRRMRPRTVVSLIDEAELADENKSMFKAEAELLKRKGITQVKIVVPLGGYPGTQDVQRFLAIVEDPANRPVLVHCAQGVRRTGMMVAAHQESILGWDKDRVKKEMRTFDHSRRLVTDLEHFVDIYDPRTRTVTAEPSNGDA